MPNLHPGRLPLLVALAGLGACASNPDAVSLDGGAPSRLASCLIEGGALALAADVPLDVAFATALGVAPDGDVLIGEGLGATNIAPAFLDHTSYPPAMHLVLPADGRPLRAAAASSDGARFVMGDDSGQLAVYARASGDLVAWTALRDAAIRALAATADGRVAFVDADYSGTPTLWDPAQEGVPVGVQTKLWNAWTTSFFDSDRQWLVAGDWYGVPMIEVRDVAAPEAVAFEWLYEIGRIGSGTITVAVASGDGVVIAGPIAFEDDGFLGVVDRATGEAVTHRLTGHRPRFGALLPGGRVLLTVGEQAHLVAWDVASGAELARIAVDDYRELTGTDGLGVHELAAPIAAHPDGEHVLVGAHRGVHVVACAD